MNKNLIIYRVVTGLFTVHTLFTTFAYFFMYEMTSAMFVSLGVSAAIIYPLAIVKFLGLVAIVTNKSPLLKQLAYLGFAIDFVAAMTLHSIAGDGGWIAPFVVLIILIASYIYNRKVEAAKE